jgi:hypothetical protein
MPTAASTTFTAARCDPLYGGKCPEQNVAIIPSVTITKGTIVGELTATPGTFKAYASGNGDGSQVAKGIMVYSVTTDASSNITIAGEYGQTQKYCPIYMGGGLSFFKISDLTGLDAAGLVNLGGSLVEGIITAGVIKL